MQTFASVNRINGLYFQRTGNINLPDDAPCCFWTEFTATALTDSVQAAQRQQDQTPADVRRPFDAAGGVTRWVDQYDRTFQ